MIDNKRYGIVRLTPDNAVELGYDPATLGEYLGNGLWHKPGPVLTDAECAANRAAYDARERTTNLKDLESATELICDICGDTFGYVRENDLNGSRFFCAWCKSHPSEAVK